MGDTVNLRQFRKRKKRQDRELKADENRKFHGVSSTKKKSIRLENAKNITNLEAHRLEKD